MNIIKNDKWIYTVEQIGHIIFKILLIPANNCNIIIKVFFYNSQIITSMIELCLSLIINIKKIIMAVLLVLLLDYNNFKNWQIMLNKYYKSNWLNLIRWMMITFNSISPSILLKLVLQALGLFILKIISIMAKLKLNFLNLIRDIPKT